ncbi:MAG: hypothetical protein H6648_01430 [Caldilineae bacterium]|nr:hypothetical protein [Chloroflexota bacterium]MCB9175792.1 hypothetical protein [Caldilineae bacterium]
MSEPSPIPAPRRLALAFTLAAGLALCAGGAPMAVAEGGPAAPHPIHVPAQGPAGSEQPIYLPLALRAARPELAYGRHAPVFGVQLSEMRYHDANLIVEARAAGASYWRAFIFWDEIEPVQTSPPSYDWSRYDLLFGRASAQGLRIIAEISGNPSWAADYPGGPPRNLDDLARFAAAAVERYDGDGLADAPGGIRIREWELYNEPDLADPKIALQGRGWGFWGHRGAEYARMLRRVYPVIKLANPEARVILGGLAHDAFLPDDGPFDPDFLDDLLEAGGGRFFDVMNFHYYPPFAPAYAAHGIDVLGKAGYIRKKLRAYGLEKPLMITEAGMWSAAEPPYPPATPEDQLRYVAQLYTRVLAGDIETAIWFQYDDVYGVDDPARGLVDGDLRRKPAWSAYQLASEMLAGAVPERPARDPLASGEVYWFRQGEDRLAVAWTLDGSSAQLDVRAPEAEWVHALGNRRLLRDASDGRRDGITRIPYGADPVFVRVPASP